MKVYTILYFSHWDYENEAKVLGVFSTKEKAKEFMKKYVKEHIETHNNSNYDPETDFYWNEDGTYFDAYEEKNYDEEWLLIEEKEIDNETL